MIWSYRFRVQTEQKNNSSICPVLGYSVVLLQDIHLLDKSIVTVFYFTSMNIQCLSSLSQGIIFIFAPGEGIDFDSPHSGVGWFFQYLLLLYKETFSDRLGLGQCLLPLQFPHRYCCWHSALCQSTPNKKRDFYACRKAHLFLPASKFWRLTQCCWPVPQPVIPTCSLHIDFLSFLWTDESIYNTSSLWRQYREE